ncbi:MAG: tetratricopeptide repeat protein [Bdellovibrionota bacterium]
MKSFLLALVLFVFIPVGHAAKSQSGLAYQNYTRGVELAAHKKWKDALEKFQSAIDLNPAYVASYIEYARTAVMAGERTKGLQKLTAALEFARSREDRERIGKERDSLSEIFYTNETFQLYQNGLNYLKLDRGSSALEALEKALKTEPDNVMVLTAYGRTLRDQDRIREAQEVLERALVLNDGKREVKVELAEIFLAAKPEKSLQLIKPMLENLKEERIASIYAQGLSATKRNREAIEFLKSSYEKQPSWVFAPLWLGKLYAQEPDGGWNARKYLMIFLRRTEVETQGATIDSSPEALKIKAARAEAEAILARVNRALE